MKKLLFIALLLLQPYTTSAAPQIEIRWLGGPTMEITFDGTTFITDPMLGEGKHAFLMGDPNESFDLNKGPNIKYHARKTPLPPYTLAKLDFVLLSHAHEDHFDQVAQQRINKTTKLILPHGDRTKVTALGFTNLQSLAPGDAVKINTNNGHITLHAITADHSLDPSLTPLLGEGLGYVMHFTYKESDTTLYWSGDSMPSERVIKSVKAHGKIDVLIPNMGRVGTTGPLGQISMGAKDAANLAKTLKVSSVLPIHHSTYDLYLEPIDQLPQYFNGDSAKLKMITEGQSVFYTLH